MQLKSQSDGATPMTARLLIHAEGERRNRFGSRLQWLRALSLVRARQAKRAPLRLKIEDLQGRAMLAIEDAGTTIELALPAGTYQVNAQIGEERRSYTMTLAAGRSFDLHLRFGPRASPGRP